MKACSSFVVILLASGVRLTASQCASAFSTLSDPVFTVRQVVTREAMGARAAVTADFDGDGDTDVVSASSTDNTVAWYEQQAGGTWSIKKQVTYLSNGARIVSSGDINKDGYVDILVASYYDNTVGWFKNDGSGSFASISKITKTALNAQGVTVADIDSDGDLDVISASSGDNTVAWYKNIGQNGRFCEVKNIVDNNAVGVRTVVAADLDGDGTVDLASASKDDNTIAWYPNLAGNGSFPTKIVINGQAKGAYSLVAVDLDKDGWMDLVTASNADDTVAFYRNTDGRANFVRYVIYDQADFVLSVTAGDFDGDGDIDVASASYFDGAVRWYENLNGLGTSWRDRTIYMQASAQAHYVFSADVDGDGDTDLLAVTQAENTVAVYYAATNCDNSTTFPRSECCRTGQEWDGTACTACQRGKYGDPSAVTPRCIPCPTGCPRRAPKLSFLPNTCYDSPLCKSPATDIAQCDCPANTYLDDQTDTCAACPAGHVKSQTRVRTLNDARETWPGFNRSLCILYTPPIPTCNPGHFYNITTSQCQMCPGGTSSTGQSTTSCTPCSAGFFCPPAAAFQRPCTAGNFSGPSAIQCTRAPPGTYVSLPASAQASPCEPGTFAQDAGMTQCQSCNRAYFADTNLTASIGAHACTPCPPDTTTVTIGSRKLLDCVCVQGTYHDCRGTDCRVGVTNPNATGFCKKCPLGAVCTGPADNPTAMRSGNQQTGYIHTAPRVEKGFMAIESRVFKCGGFGEACPGSFLYRPFSEMCSEDGSDIGCAFCASGSLFNGRLCIKCEVGGVVLPILLSFLAVMAWIVLTIITFPPEPHGTLTISSIKKFTCSMVMSSTLATLLVVLQGQWTFSTLGLKWPKTVYDVMQSSGSVLDLSAFRLSCTTTPEAWAIWSTVVANVLPAIIFGYLFILGIAGKCAKNGTRIWPSRTIANTQILKLFSTFFLMIVTGAIGRGFSVITHPDGSYSLRAFPYIHENSQTFILIQAVSASGVLIWCVGGLTVILYLLYKLPTRHDDIGFRLSTLGMVIRFNPATPWWYVVMLLNSMAIGLAGTVAELPQTQSLYLCVVFIVYLTGLLSMRPFRCEVCYYAEVSATVGQLITVLVGQYHDGTGKYDFLVVICLFTTIGITIFWNLFASWQVFRVMRSDSDAAEKMLLRTGIKFNHKLPRTGLLSELVAGPQDQPQIGSEKSLSGIPEDEREYWLNLKRENEHLKAELHVMMLRRSSRSTDNLEPVNEMKPEDFEADAEEQHRAKSHAPANFEIGSAHEHHYATSVHRNVFNGRLGMTA